MLRRVIIRWFLLFILLFELDCLRSLGFGNFLVGFGMVFAKAILPIETSDTVAFVATLLSTSRALASVPVASAAFRAFVTFASSLFAFPFGQLVDGRLLSCDSGLKVFDGGEGILILFWLPCRIHSLKFLPLVDSFLDPQV